MYLFRYPAVYLLPAIVLAFNITPPSLPRVFKRREVNADNFCFPPYSTFSLRTSNIGLNKSVFIFEQLWVSPSMDRIQFSNSLAPFDGVEPDENDLMAGNFLNDYARGVSYVWGNYRGSDVCQKGVPSPGGSAICIGGGLTRNTTRIQGRRPVTSWVGQDDESQCWHSVMVEGGEATDPAQWLSTTSQCPVSQNQPMSGAYVAAEVSEL